VLKGGEQSTIDTSWSSGLAYAVGLIVSDGYLSSDKAEVGFVSKDLELVETFASALGIQNRITPSGRGGSIKKEYWQIRFKRRDFYDFLLSIGLTPRKSKTIGSINVPPIYFSHFVRGVFDGDGTFWTWWDKRWPNSFGYTLGISSASLSFLNWLQGRLAERYDVKGYLHQGDGVYTIRYAKGDTRALYRAMYASCDSMYLTRKRRKIDDAFAFDKTKNRASLG